MMNNDREKTLEEAIRDIPWSRILVPFFLALFVAALFVFFSVRTVGQEKPSTNFIVVHTGESKTFLYNPLTHEEVRNETADGNVILTVQPKKE